MHGINKYILKFKDAYGKLIKIQFRSLVKARREQVALKSCKVHSEIKVQK